MPPVDMRAVVCRTGERTTLCVKHANGGAAGGGERWASVANDSSTDELKADDALLAHVGEKLCNQSYGLGPSGRCAGHSELLWVL